MRYFKYICWLPNGYIFLNCPKLFFVFIPKRLVILLACIHLLFSHAWSQDSKVDSLYAELEKTGTDSLRVGLLTALSNHFIPINTDSATLFANEALVLANELDYQRGMGEIYAILGDIEVTRDNLYAARGHYLTAIDYKEAAGLNRELASLYMVLGNIYLAQDNYVEALDFYQQGIQFALEFDQSRELQFIYNNLGLTYQSLKNYEKALDYFEKSLDLSREQGNTQNLSSLYVNIGLIYNEQNELELARSYFEKAYRLNLETGNSAGQAISLNSLGSLSNRLKKYNESLSYFYAALRAVENAESSYLGPKSRITTYSYSNMGNAYFHLNRYDSAVICWEKGLDLAEQTGQVGMMRDNCEHLSEVFERLNKPTLSLDYYKRFKLYADSIRNEEVVKQITTLELQFDFNKELKERELKQTMRDAEQKRKELLYLMIIGGALLSVVIILLLFILQRNKVTRIELSQENLELEKQKLQKELEYKNKELTTNVMYLLRKNEMIMNITARLKKARLTYKPENRKTAEDIIRELEQGITKDTWKEFELRFQDVHSDFYDKLNTLYPDLSPNELRLCAFLRLNMTTKDIAAITYLSVNSINVARHRLRKKLDIDQDENLIKYLSQL